MLLAEIPEIKNFESAKKLAAFAGLSPSQYSSGTSVRKRTRICKIGNSRIRKALYFPAITAMGSSPINRGQRKERKSQVEIWDDQEI